ncbi:MAG: hypothetical protein QOE25_1211, partial [Actinomycetota bacterium]|nr:hypothetical protein [Actinomycetota bacterium]
MELTEAFDRVVLRHKLLIAMCVFLAIGAVLGLTFTAPKLYQANVRMVLDATDPTSETAAQGLADAAKGIATSPSSISQALHEVGISRDPVVVARRISVAPLGSSGVLVLSVQDTDQAVVSRLAYAVANQVIERRKSISYISVNQVVTKLSGEIASTASQMDDLTKKYDTITQQIAATDKASTIASLESKQSDLLSQRNDLASQKQAYQIQLTSVQSNALLGQTPSIVDKGTLTVKAVPSNVETNIALGVLLGLLVGIALAGLRETLSPTVGGRVSLSRQAGAPFLGSVPAPRYAGNPKKVAEVAAHVQLAAANAGVSRVELLHVDEQVDLHPLANDLRAVLDSQHPRSKVDIAVVGD